jgi:hypothetical protein
MGFDPPAERGLCMRDGLSQRLGWTGFEQVDSNHDGMLSLPIVVNQII